MFRLILLTTAALFGVLALYGTPELAGTGAQPAPRNGLSVRAAPEDEITAPPARDALPSAALLHASMSSASHEAASKGAP